MRSLGRNIVSKGNDRPKPRLAPPAAAVAATQQDALDRLQKLDGWTGQPTNQQAVVPPPQAPAETDATNRDAPAAAERPKRPWETPSSKETHPYHIILSESLYQKIDYVWKRNGDRSAKAFVLKALEDAANQALRDMGIEP
jgi:hypothetical protein